jgi:hypothetical protein
MSTSVSNLFKPIEPHHKDKHHKNLYGAEGPRVSFVHKSLKIMLLIFTDTDQERDFLDVTRAGGGNR